MTRRRALERWETKIDNSEVTCQAVWPIAKCFIKRDLLKAPTSIRGRLGLKSYPLEKSNAIADCLENQFATHGMCDENHERRVEARVQVLLEAVDNKCAERISPCDIIGINKFLEIEEGLGIDGNPNEYLRLLPGTPLAYLTNLSNRCHRIWHFRRLERKHKY
jgi:hypothetical protein